MDAYQDPNHVGNSERYHTGETCCEKGCTEPAGTWWSPYWCFKHNVERIDRISSTLENELQRMELIKLVNKETESLREYCARLIEERDKAAQVVWKPIGAKRIKDRDVLLTVGSGWIRRVGRWRDPHPQRQNPKHKTSAGWWSTSGSYLGTDFNWYAEIPPAPSSDAPTKTEGA